MEESSESFNMAVATLMRLDGILKRMELASEILYGVNEQRLQIKLLRHFFSNATPLMGIAMKPEEFESYKKRVFAVKLRSKVVRGRRIIYYDYSLDDEIMSIVMEIQLKIKGYFMPTTKKKRMF